MNKETIKRLLEARCFIKEKENIYIHGHIGIACTLFLQTIDNNKNFKAEKFIYCRDLYMKRIIDIENKKVLIKIYKELKTKNIKLLKSFEVDFNKTIDYLLER